MGFLEEVNMKTAQEAWQEFLKHYQPVELTPSYHGEKCLGNGEHEIECQCDECEHYLECFPDWKPGTIWDEHTQRFV